MPQKQKAALYLASAWIPILIYLFVFFLLGIAPFGSKTMLANDAGAQYIDFLSYWKTVLSGENNLFYSFSKNIGGNFYGLAAYYLLSPLNLLYFFSTIDTLPLFYTFIFLIKIGFCGLSFFTLSTHLYECSWKNLLFSTAYALMAYNVLFAFHSMWIDGVMILPFLFLGLCLIFQQRSSRVYVISLAYALVSNFYIGYMLCIASVLFFFALLSLQESGKAQKKQATLRFLLSSGAAGFATAVVWLPAIVSLIAERAKTTPVSHSWKQHLFITDILANLSCGVFNRCATNSAPLIFCGSIVSVLVLLFFLNRSIPNRHKAVTFLLLAVFLFSFTYTLPNLVWHGFSATNCFYFRYSFIFTFLLILIGQYQFHHSPDLPFYAVPFSAVSLIALLQLSAKSTFKSLVFPGMGTTFAVILLIALCMLLLQKRRPHTYAVALCFLTGIELFLNCNLCWVNLLNTSDPLDRTAFSSYVSQTQPAIEYLQDRDPGFYRIEKTFHRSKNDAFLLDYPGLSHFSSTESYNLKPFMRKMGFSTYYNFWAYYGKGSTAEADSFLGVKYLLSDGALPLEKDYELIDTVNGIQIYENKSALPVCFPCNSQILTVAEDADPFVFHNRLWNGITGTDQPILSAASYDVSCQNLIQTTNPDGSICYTKDDPAQSACIRYTIPVAHQLPLYYYIAGPESAYFPGAPEDQEASISVNGIDHGRYFYYDSWNMACAGTYSPGDTVIIDIIPSEDSITISGAWFYYERDAVLQEQVALVRQQVLQVEKACSSRLTGSVSVGSDQLLLFTIPYEKGWHLKLDRQNTEVFSVLDALMAAELPAGEHEFELYYIPPGFREGLLLTGMTLALLFVINIVAKKHRSQTV